MALIKVSELTSTGSVKIDDILMISSTSGSGYTSNRISIEDLVSSQPFLDLGSSGTAGTSGTSGSNGSSGSSGSNGSSGSSGTSGYVDNDWLYFTPSTATIPSTGNNFILSGTTTSNGSVSYNQSTGIITLAANKTYKLNASFALANNINNAETQYQWINVTTSNTLIGNIAEIIAYNFTMTSEQCIELSNNINTKYALY
jgi:hypothetical protein